MKHMDHAPNRKVKVGAAEVIFKDTPFRTPAEAYEDPTWPTMAQTVEDTFEAPQSDGELYHSPVLPVVPKGTPEEHQALHTFLNMASAAERGLTDNVVLPKHYARFNIEPVRFICENNLNFFQANIIKYILRWDAKNGMEDLQKAKRYLTMFIKFVAKDPDWWKGDAA
jgi:hypothetical protein